jgi:thioredoxin 1
MIINLDRSNIDAQVAKPGVTLLNWKSGRQPLSRRFDVGFANASARHPDVVFGDIDVNEDRSLTADWGVEGAPELMAYRDGALVFDFPGALPEPIIDTLVEAIRKLDMDQVRQGLDGTSTRLFLSIPTGPLRFDLGDEEGDDGPGRGPGPGGGKPARH